MAQLLTNTATVCVFVAGVAGVTVSVLRHICKSDKSETQLDGKNNTSSETKAKDQNQDEHRAKRQVNKLKKDKNDKKCELEEKPNRVEGLAETKNETGTISSKDIKIVKVDKNDEINVTAGVVNIDVVGISQNDVEAGIESVGSEDNVTIEDKNDTDENEDADSNGEDSDDKETSMDSDFVEDGHIFEDDKNSDENDEIVQNGDRDDEQSISQDDEETGIESDGSEDETIDDNDSDLNDETVSNEDASDEKESISEVDMETGVESGGSEDDDNGSDGNDETVSNEDDSDEKESIAEVDMETGVEIGGSEDDDIDSDGNDETVSNEDASDDEESISQEDEETHMGSEGSEDKHPVEGNNDCDENDEMIQNEDDSGDEDIINQDDEGVEGQTNESEDIIEARVKGQKSNEYRDTGSKEIKKGNKIRFKETLHDQMPMENDFGARYFNKIHYNELDVIDVRHGVKICNGTYEGGVHAAIKVSPIDISDIEKMKDEFNILDRKLKKTVDINHKLMPLGSENIVKYFCYEFGLDSDNPHRLVSLIALERCHCNLYRFMEERSSFEVISNQEIYKQLTKGLHFLHSRNIVHRDIKPSNVLIKIEDNERLVFKLSDFAVAKAGTCSESGYSTSGPFGSFGWMAPEVHNTKTSYRESDIFSLGQVFYYIESNKCFVFKNQDDIQRGKADFSQITGKRSPFRLLVENMLSVDRKERPVVAKILTHPVLWDANKTLQFFETMKGILDERPSDIDIESDKSNRDNILGGDAWNRRLSYNVEKHLFPTVRGQPTKRSRPGPFYKRTSIQALINAVRNNKVHYHSLPDEVKKELGKLPEGYLNYWTKRYPDLLMHCYNVFREKRSKYTSLKAFY